MRGPIWYIERWLKYYFLKPNYQIEYETFRNYCHLRKKHEDSKKSRH